jgi:hypothetical protein
LREEGEGCRWRTREGIGIGTRLSSLEVLNEGPFVLTGFEWDYSGTVISWEGGALEGVLNAGGWRSWIRLSPRTDAAGNWIPAVAYEEMDPLLGERDVSSAHPLMQRLDPGIYSIGFEIDR